MCDNTDIIMEKNNQHIDFNLLTRYLADELTLKEQVLVKNWIDASDNNRKDFEELKQAWNFVDKTGKKQEIHMENEWRYHQKLMNSDEQSSKTIFIKTFIRIAAAIIIGVGITLTGIRYKTQFAVRTKIAETNEIELPDGSVVTLNAGSKLTYSKKDFGSENRTISLHGEAYFEVETDLDHPFIIQLDKAEIKVLGTSFNVRAYKKMDAIEVIVSEGKVSLYDREVKQKRVIATNGEKAEFDKQLGIVKKYPNADRNYKAWKTRSIVFENDSLRNIVKTLENIYHTRIVLENTGLNACTLTTSFEDEDLQTVLKVLESTLDLEIKVQKKEIIISGEGC